MQSDNNIMQSNNNIMESDVYDVILIGDNLTTYMASIYIQTSNYTQLVIKKSSPEDLDFKGCDKVAGVLDVKNNEDLLNRVRDQTINLKVPVIKEEINSINVDGNKEVMPDKFEVITSNKSYYTKCLVYNDSDFKTEGLFNSKMEIFHNEAIELLGNGCKLSFEIREFISKHPGIKSGDRKNTKLIF